MSSISLVGSSVSVPLGKTSDASSAVAFFPMFENLQSQEKKEKQKEREEYFINALRVAFYDEKNHPVLNEALSKAFNEIGGSEGFLSAANGDELKAIGSVSNSVSGFFTSKIRDVATRGEADEVTAVPV